MRGSRIAGISRRAALAALAGFLLLAAPQGLAGPMQKPVLIGALTASWGPTPHLPGLIEGLAKLGYRENEDFVVGVRFTKGSREALLEAARELVRDGVDILYVVSDAELDAARAATGSIPIVAVALIEDPVRGGLVRSFARPGGNVTGISGAYASLSPKRLEYLREMVPGLREVLYVYAANDQIAVRELGVLEASAKNLRIGLIARAVRDQRELEAALKRLDHGSVDAVLAPLYSWLDIPGQLLEPGVRNRIPTMFGDPWFVEQGGLASYGPSFRAIGFQSARLVDKIMRGADPGSIPVEVMSDLELVINLKTAKALGLEIPREVLFQATRIIR